MPAYAVRVSELSVASLSWEEFLDLPADALRHAELIDGRVVVNAPTPLHRLMAFRLRSAIDDWAHDSPGRGEVTEDEPVQVAARRGYQPDVAWFPAERCAPPGEPPSYTSPPGLIAEVLSPTTRGLDTIKKRRDYARVRVGELWLLDPEPCEALLLRRSPGLPDTAEYDVVVEVAADQELTSPLLPGFAIGLGDLRRR